MIRAVLDTNILASGLVSEHGTLSTLFDYWADELFTAVTSEHILEELAHTLSKPYFQKSPSDEWIAQTVERVRKGSIVIPITTVVQGIATHTEDDLVIATATSGNADFLVTGDRQLLALRAYESIRIVTATQFLEIVETLAEH